MHIVILCATQRGYRFAEHLMNVGRGHRFTVFSFRETAWEPPFLDDIEQLARQHNHSFYETRNVAHSKWDTFWREAAVDLLLMVGWRYLVPAKVYHRARRGAFVFHDSLLPTYRGFAPTVWAMVNGESQTGATLFRVAEDVDAGDIVDQRAIAIGFDETIADVIEHVTQAYLGYDRTKLHELVRRHRNRASAETRRRDLYLQMDTCGWIDRLAQARAGDLQPGAGNESPLSRRLHLFG